LSREHDDFDRPHGGQKLTMILEIHHDTELFDTGKYEVKSLCSVNTDLCGQQEFLPRWS
jgi:hypothetical protein